jgi:hypothetical protein
MNANKRLTMNFRDSRDGAVALRALRSNPGLCVTVIATTPKGTTAALNEARRLATDLEAHITLLKLEVVPSRFPLDKPPISLDTITREQCSLVLQSNAREENVTVRVCLCRDRDLSFRQILRRRALVVIGGKRHWWSSNEERLEQALRRFGHHVIFVDMDRRTDQTSRGNFPLSLRGAGRFHEQAGAAGPIFGAEDSR